MTLYVTLATGHGIPFATAVIDNFGHPNDGNHLPTDDLRLYGYDVMILGAHDDACPRGEITHRRREGAWALVHAVLDDCRDRLPRYDTETTPPPETRS